MELYKLEVIQPTIDGTKVIDPQLHPELRIAMGVAQAYRDMGYRTKITEVEEDPDEPKRYRTLRVVENFWAPPEVGDPKIKVALDFWDLDMMWLIHAIEAGLDQIEREDHFSEHTDEAYRTKVRNSVNASYSRLQAQWRK